MCLPVHERRFTHMGKHMNLDDRMSIQTGLKDNLSFTEIAKNSGKDKSTIRREILKHRIFIPYYNVTTLQTHNVCVHRSSCKIREKCKSPTCFKQHMSCRLCGGCNSHCEDFQEEICDKYKQSPFVCNGCPRKSRCPLSKWLYDAKKAQLAYETERSESRQGIALSENELQELDEFISPLLKKGQSIRNICNLYKSQLPVSDRTIYNYMHERVLSADLFDLKRTVQRKERKKPGPALLVDKKCRNGRLYSDFLEYINENPDVNVVEIDTVEGTRGGKSLLTLYFRNCNLQLAFLEEKNNSACVKKVFDKLRSVLTEDEFSTLFPVILTDRGSEFSNPLDIEMDPETGELQSKVFYCDPQRPEQKSNCERNHEFIRYFLPKGSSFNNLSQEKIDLMMCHINSYGRSEFNFKSPTELFKLIYNDTTAAKLNINLIQPHEINLTGDLIK